MNPALAGLLRQLPPYNQPFPAGQKEKWFAAFRAIIDLDYPEAGYPSPPPDPYPGEFELGDIPAPSATVESPPNGSSPHSEKL